MGYASRKVYIMLSVSTYAVASVHLFVEGHRNSVLSIVNVAWCLAGGGHDSLWILIHGDT